jgi:Tol biopolymer transport system component
MSPEQARGRQVDRRSDIWAFGAVLYEMLTAKQPFAGDTVSDALASVLTKDPDWEKLPASTPAPLRTLIRRCLERDPRNRLQAIGEARIALADPAALDAATGRPPRRTPTLAITALVAIAAAAAGFAVRALTGGSRTESAAIRKVDIAVPDFHVTVDRAPVISPDGRWMLYNGGSQLWIRSLEEFTTRKIAGGTGAHYGFWSPDSREVAFVRDGKLWRAAIDGGDATPVAPVPADMTGSAGGVWLDNGEMLLVGSDTVGLLTINASGGSSREVLKLAHPEESDFHTVSALPNGRGVLFSVHGPTGADRFDVFANGTRKTVLQIRGEGLSWPIYAAPGYLVYSRLTTSPGIWAVPFSLDRMQTEGEPFLVVANGSYPSVAADGTLALVRASDMPSQIVSVDRKGSVQTLAALQGQAWDTLQWTGVTLSPDGRRLAIVMNEPDGVELWSYDLGRGMMTKLTVGGMVVVNPTWSSDGSRLFFATFAGQRVWNVFAVPASEMAKPEPVMPPADETQWPCTISPDGALVYGRMSDRGIDLWLSPLDGTAGHPLIRTPFNESDAAFSRDGHAIAYTSDESGRSEVYVRAFPLDARRMQVSSAGGTRPRWSADGRELYYRSASGIVATRIARAPMGIEATGATELFALGADPTISTSYAVAPDGQHFLFTRSTGTDRISVVLNWAAPFQH